MDSKIKQRFIGILLESGVLKFGSFQTKAGRTSPYFFNTGNICSGAHMSEVAEIYAQALIEAFPKGFSVLFGPAYKGIPLAVATSMKLKEKHGISVTFSFDRKEEKTRGEGGVFIGKKIALEDQVVIIEDVISGGTSARSSIELLKDAKIEGLLVGIDRQEFGNDKVLAAKEIETNYSIPVHAIVTLDEIVALLYQKTVLGKVWIDDAMMEKIRAYQKQYRS